MCYIACLSEPSVLDYHAKNTCLEISVIGLWCLHINPTCQNREPLLRGSTRNEPNKPTQLAKRTLINVSGSSQYWFQLVTVISKMQSVLEFNDVRTVNVIRLDRRYDAQTPRIRRPPRLS